jgi:hypothetical protein
MFEFFGGHDCLGDWILNLIDSVMLYMYNMLRYFLEFIFLFKCEQVVRCVFPCCFYACPVYRKVFCLSA